MGVGQSQNHSPPEKRPRLIAENDGPFKHHLDRFKYASRFPDQQKLDHWSAAMAILMGWNHRLARRAGCWAPPRPLLSTGPCCRSCVSSGSLIPPGSTRKPESTALHHWLASFLAGSRAGGGDGAPLGGTRQPWCSPAWIYHLALEPEWQAACLERQLPALHPGAGAGAGGLRSCQPCPPGRRHVPTLSTPMRARCCCSRSIPGG